MAPPSVHAACHVVDVVAATPQALQEIAPPPVAAQLSAAPAPLAAWAADAFYCRRLPARASPPETRSPTAADYPPAPNHSYRRPAPDPHSADTDCASRAASVAVAGGVVASDVS